LPPFGLLNASFWTYFSRLRSACPSDPPGGRIAGLASAGALRACGLATMPVSPRASTPF